MHLFCLPFRATAEEGNSHFRQDVSRFQCPSRGFLLTYSLSTGSLLRRRRMKGGMNLDQSGQKLVSAMCI